MTYVIDNLYKEHPSSEDEIDPEMFERLVVMTRAVAVNRPENLLKFTKELSESLDPTTVSLPMKLISTFWRFYQASLGNTSLESIAHSAMHHTEIIIFALVEIFHAFILVDSSYVAMVTEIYVQLLLCQVCIR